jgi:hydrogenase 3 maturation protease
VKNGLILTVGNEMMGDDGAGPYLARRLQQAPLEGWEVIDGQTAPENFLHQVRAMQPERVVVVDAADAGLEPGEIYFLDEAAIDSLFIMTTHTLPLSFLIVALKEILPEVRFIGIQPDVVSFGYPMTDAVRQAVETLYQQLEGGRILAMLAEWEQDQNANGLFQFSQ